MSSGLTEFGMLIGGPCEFNAPSNFYSRLGTSWYFHFWIQITYPDRATITSEDTGDIRLVWEDTPVLPEPPMWIIKGPTVSRYKGQQINFDMYINLGHQDLVAFYFELSYNTRLGTYEFFTDLVNLTIGERWTGMEVTEDMLSEFNDKKRIVLEVIF